VLGALAKLRTATISFVVSVVLRTFPILLGSTVHSKGRNGKGYRPQVGKVQMNEVDEQKAMEDVCANPEKIASN